MSRATLISGPTTLKFTAGRKQGKNSATPGQNPWNPQDWGRNPKTPKVVRVETLFYVAIDVSIDIKRSGGQKGHVLYSRRGLVKIVNQSLPNRQKKAKSQSKNETADDGGGSVSPRLVLSHFRF